MIFSEVYGNYYNAVAEILSEAVDGKLDKKKISEIVAKKAFGESTIIIPDALLSEKWPLINEDFETPLIYKPTMPLSDIQRMWLKGILLDTRVQLFEPAMDGLEDVEPLFDNDTFVYFDRYLDGDPFDDDIYRKNFKTILGALKQKQKLFIEFNGKNSRQTLTLMPEKIEYSPKDDKFRILGVSTWKKPYIINMAKVITCEPVGESTEDETERVTDEAKKPTDESVKIIKTEFKKFSIQKETVEFELVDERNALERVMLHFSDLEKETTKLDDIHYHVKLKYYTNDETEILIRILSFGPMVKVVEPADFVKLIKERIFNQKSCE